MINGNITEFLDKVYYGEELFFEYQGTIGIIGPKRMDYKKVVNNLETVMTQLDTIFKKDKKE